MHPPALGKAAPVATRQQKEFTCSGLTVHSMHRQHALWSSSAAHTPADAVPSFNSTPQQPRAPLRLHRQAQAGRADGWQCSSSPFPRDGEPRGDVCAALSCVGAAGSGRAQPAHGSGVSRGQRSAAGRAPLRAAAVLQPTAGGTRTQESAVPRPCSKYFPRSPVRCSTFIYFFILFFCHLTARGMRIYWLFYQR